MCDFDDDFEDDGFMDEDSFEDHFEDQMDDPDDGSSMDDSEFSDLDEDEFTAKDAFYIGSIVGNIHEEGMDERKRRELLRKKRTKRDSTSD